MSAPTARTDAGRNEPTRNAGLRQQSPAAGNLRAVTQHTVAPERVSGAQSVVRSLEELGVEVLLEEAFLEALDGESGADGDG